MHFGKRTAGVSILITSKRYARARTGLDAPLPAMPVVDLHEIESLLAVRRDRASPLVTMEIAD